MATPTTTIHRPARSPWTVVLVALALLAVGRAAHAADKVDLDRIVLSGIEGYQPAPGGLNGPIPKEKFGELLGSEESKSETLDVDVTIYARTFTRAGGGPTAAVVAFDFGDANTAFDIMSAIRKSAETQRDLHAIGVEDLQDGLLLDVSSNQESVSAQKLFFRSGPVVFMVVVSQAGSSVPAGEAREIALAQQKQVPSEVSSQKPRDTSLTRSFLQVLVLLVIGAVAFVIFRRQRAATRREPEASAAPPAPE